MYSVLIVDDFLANGAALTGLISLVEQAANGPRGGGTCRGSNPQRKDRLRATRVIAACTRWLVGLWARRGA